MMLSFSNFPDEADFNLPDSIRTRKKKLVYPPWFIAKSSLKINDTSLATLQLEFIEKNLINIWILT